ncbi:DUF6919 domain-containing protein [Kribbella solani]|uniref:DUF6919 domain-containing protein n=1 Tax=Kribbella solani TaxID=236067 RepID=A0A841E4R6_9ACTN|nr:hypothetical protein [Kribbella solani]MBB5983975.1 hypothetical protein [Kribbella solani]
MTEALVAGQLAELTGVLGEALSETAGDPAVASRLSRVQEDWAAAEPESRASLLQLLAWRARAESARDLPDVWWAEDQVRRGCMAAHLFIEYAAGHAGTGGTAAGFLGDDFPMLTAGPAGILGASLAFNRDNLTACLDTALLLTWLTRRDSAGTVAPAGTDPAPVNIKTTYAGKDVTHIVGWWRWWLDSLYVKVPTALCGAYLGVDEPDDPNGPEGELEDDFDPDRPTCERCERRARRRSLSERIAAWRENRRLRRATEDAWAAAGTFTDLCGLTARWLEGGLTEHPGGYDEPDPETIELVPFLAGLNRAGFLTFGSQPGLVSRGYDGADWRQRAAVHGFVADTAVLQALTQAAVEAGLWIVAQPPAAGPHAPAFSLLNTVLAGALSDGPGADRGDGWVVVTTRDGEPCTDFGGRMPASYIKLTYGDWCDRAAVDAVSTAHQVAVIDPVWGRDDLLWPTLTNALTDLTRRSAPREDTGR